MFHLKLEKNIKKIQVATAAVFLVCGFFLMVNFSAAVGLEVGSNLLGLSGTQNLYYGTIASTSSSTTGLMLLQKNSVDMFKVDNAGNIFANGDFEMGHNKSIKINSASIDTTLLLGNYLGATTTFVYGASGINKVASLAVEGDVKADRLCIEDDCKAAWSEIVSAGGGGTWVLNGSNLYASSTSWNVGIGTTNPLNKLDVVAGSSDGASSLNGVRIQTGTGANPQSIQLGANDTGTYSWIQSRQYGIAANNLSLNPHGGNVGIGTTSPQAKFDIFASNVALGASYATPGNLVIHTSDALGVNIGGSISLGGKWSSGLPSNISSFARLSGRKESAVDGAAGGYLAFEISRSDNPYISERMRITSVGNVGIGTTNPLAKLQIGNLNGSGGGEFWAFNDAATTRFLFGDSSSGGHFGGMSWNKAGAYLGLGHSSSNSSLTDLIINSSGNVGIGTTAPNDVFYIGGSGGTATTTPGDDRTGHNYTNTYTGADPYSLVNVGYMNSTLDAAYLTIDTASTTYLHLAGGTMSGDINMGGGSSTISNLNKLIVDKITATTIDPLYNINKINYSTFAPSIAGGVKEEFVGKANIKRKNKVLNEYEYIIDFNSEHEGTDLWVWRKVIDYGDDTVQVLITPSKKFAAVYYVIENNRLIFRADKPVEISYRLVGSRFDWRKWPTKALDQSEMGTVVK